MIIKNLAVATYHQNAKQKHSNLLFKFEYSGLMIQELSVVYKNYLIEAETDLKYFFGSIHSIQQFPIYGVFWVHDLQPQWLHCYAIKLKRYNTNHLACTPSNGNQ